MRDIVCAQNVSGMVSRVEGTRYRCPWGHSPPAAHSHSAKTRRLHLQPFSILSSFSPARTDLEQRGRIRRGAQPVVKEESRRGGNDCRLSEIDGGREEFGGKLLGPINPSELCFPESECVWVSYNGQSEAE